MSFDKYIQLCNHHHHQNKDIDHFHHLQKLPRSPLSSIRLLSAGPQGSTDLLSVAVDQKYLF